MEQQVPLVEWGWRAALGFIVTGLLGLVALTVRTLIPMLGERMYRVYGERAFKAEIERGLRTTEVVTRIEPIVMQNAEQLDHLELRVETGFATLDRKLERIADNIVNLAKAVGRVEAR